MKKYPPLILTKLGYWQELKDLAKDGLLPSELADTLISVIDAHINGFIAPQSSPHLVTLAKKHLLHGIELSDTAADYYDLMVYIPNKEKTTRRSFFHLVRKWPKGRLRYLDEV